VRFPSVTRKNEPRALNPSFCIVTEELQSGSLWRNASLKYVVEGAEPQQQQHTGQVETLFFIFLLNAQNILYLE